VVQRRRLLGDRGPGESLEDPLSTGAAHRSRAMGVAKQLVYTGGGPGDETRGILRLVRNEEAREAIVDDLDDASGGGGDDRSLAGHRLEVDDSERLVDRRTDEHVSVAQELDHVALRQHLVDPGHVATLGAQARHPPFHLGADLRSVGCTGAEHELRLGVESSGRLE